MLQRIKVLQCIRQGLIGGGESHLLSLMENLDQTRFEPIVLSFTDGPMIERLKEMNIKTHVIATEKPFNFTKWYAVKKFMQHNKIELVHAHGTRAVSNILWAARFLRLPVIYTVHGWSFHQDQKFLVKRLRILGEEYLTSKANVNISVSASNQQSGKSHIRSFKSVVINNGINLKKFNPANNFKDIRAEFKISTDKIVILFIARFTAHKQPLALIKAFANALPSNKKMHLLMVGDGDQKEDAIKLIRTFGIEDAVTLKSFRSDVPDILAASNIFVLPSLWEGLPIALLEAMALGKAVIATNVDGTVEIVSNGDNGILINTDNLVDELTNALVSISRDEKKRIRLGEMATKTVDEKFNAVIMTRAIEAVYEKTMIGKIRPESRRASLQGSLN